MRGGWRWLTEASAPSPTTVQPLVVNLLVPKVSSHRAYVLYLLHRCHLTFFTIVLAGYLKVPKVVMHSPQHCHYFSLIVVTSILADRGTFKIMWDESK